MRPRPLLQHTLIGATVLLLVGARSNPADRSVLTKTSAALDAFASIARPLSHAKALETAFRGYFAYRAVHPDDVTKPYLYFVDYGLPSTRPRGYVFDMESLKVVEGPFTVAHGRGSSDSRYGIPTRFSNRPGSAATSLGLYLAQETYAFNGRAAGGRYRSLGLRLKGVSGDYNDNARVRGVVAHGAPYVTGTKAGRSEGCPAMEQTRARRLLPKLAEGGMVFLFAPEKDWMLDDPWILAGSE
ncbi:MAG: murein L,D-transpeptidase catalytic domain-containing protein [Gemmatimonadaceae bacterium]